jgi:hypothetical protein
MTNVDDVRLTGSQINWGNLEGLVGTWQGANGFNMIAVPDQHGGFRLLVAPYTETLIVNKVPATTPNRGLYTIANLPTLQYSTTILNITHPDDPTLMHVECGFWELVHPQTNGGFDIFRLASIPHGDAVQAMGVSSVYDGPPHIDTTLNGQPTGPLPATRGYMDPYGFPLAFPPFVPESPNKVLHDYVAQQKVIKTVELKVGTQNQGGINNILSLDLNANPTEFDATFWIETLEDGTQQLQYSQRVLISFPVPSDSTGGTIVWPHINVNTLTRTA